MVAMRPQSDSCPPPTSSAMPRASRTLPAAGEPQPHVLQKHNQPNARAPRMIKVRGRGADRKICIYMYVRTYGDYACGIPRRRRACSRRRGTNSRRSTCPSRSAGSERGIPLCLETKVVAVGRCTKKYGLVNRRRLRLLSARGSGCTTVRQSKSEKGTVVCLTPTRKRQVRGVTGGMKAMEVAQTTRLFLLHSPRGREGARCLGQE